MTMTNSVTAAAPAQSRATLGWAVRRAILGVVILTAGVAGAACLLYFTIDRDAEARAESDSTPRKPAIVRDARNH